jgi:hypothetical protein
MALRKHGILLATLLVGACGGPPEVPDHPTWADVEPILRGQCTHCHGPTAAITGSKGAAVYRLDFFDMSDGSCGEAALAMGLTSPLAKIYATSMKDAVASVNGNRPRMPPAPAPLLSEWEREVIDRWTRSTPIEKGPMPWTNRMPRLQVFSLPAEADRDLRFTVILSDPDGDPVIGIVKAGDARVNLERAGSFTVSFDARTWAKGKHALTAVLCDGWGHMEYEVGQVEIAHAP